MHSVEFTYKKVTGGFAPVIPVTLCGRGVPFSFEAYVDSGAVMSLFDRRKFASYRLTQGRTITILPFMEATINLTDKAIEKVRVFESASKEAQGKALRIYVQGGGCSGFQYGFTFDEKREDDLILQSGGVDVLIDPMSLPYLQGVTVDYVESFSGSGFSVQNPNASGSCGCGHSFSV